MNDKHFHEMDDAWMKKTKSLREQEVSKGMLKGFSASVERRLAGRQAGIAGTGEVSPKPQTSLRPAWVPVLAVMVLASVAVLRSPVAPPSALNPAGAAIELAQAITEEEQQLQEEMEVLQELGVWDETEESLEAEDELLNDPALELTAGYNNASVLA